MIELKFHKGLYGEKALQAALAAYEGFAGVQRADEGEHMIARLSSLQPDESETELAGEFANYVLGATVDGRASEGQKS